MTDFDTDERSASGSRPIDLYAIRTPTTTYRVTSHIVDVQFLGNTFIATTMSRGGQQIAQDLTGRELVVYLPIHHSLIQRFAATGIPEHEVIVELSRLQETSGLALQSWTGFATGISIDGRMAALRVPSLTDDAMKIRLPVVRAQKLCNHILFDARCALSRSDVRFHVITKITAISGTSVTVQSINTQASDFAAPAGEFLHHASGERRQIIAQSGTALTLNLPIAGAAPDDGFVTVFSSCDHDATTCRVKFENLVNFGGMPHMNSAIDPWLPGTTRVGVIVQE